jgi:hypothetical protein
LKEAASEPVKEGDQAEEKQKIKWLPVSSIVGGIQKNIFL